MGNWKYPLFVLIGGASYGLLSTAIKLGMKEGYSLQQLLSGQYTIGWIGLFVLVALFFRERLTWKLVFSLLSIGIPMSVTTIVYGVAVKELSASIAIIFMFQFAWMGVVLEAIVHRTFPNRAKIVSILILFIGTILAGGIIEGPAMGLTIKGVLCGLLSAFSFSVYIFLNSRTASHTSPFMKSFLMTTGATIVTLCVFPPTFIYDGSLINGLWPYALFLGFFGVIIPIVLFSIGTPKVGGGLGTILSAVELPVVIIASIFVLKETVSILQWIGIALILTGIIIPTIIRNKAEEIDMKKVA